MPSSLLSLRIRGVRSYSHLENKAQCIQFMPLTLIVGANGTGKTTVIESLKFIISGEEPPHSDSRRNFIHTPKVEVRSKESSYAQIELDFENPAGDICKARREISKASSTAKNPAAPSIASSYRIGQQAWVHVHKQEDWARDIPRLFGIPNKAILNNVILCHQEDNNWCMADSASVKQIFDKIFGCEQYKKELRYIEEEIRNSKKELLLSEKDLYHYKTLVQRKQQIVDEMKRVENELVDIEVATKEFDTKITNFSDKRQNLMQRLKEHESKSRKVDLMKQRVHELGERDRLLRRTLQPFLNRQVRREEPARKKHAPDPTAADLSVVIDNLEKMSLIVKELPESEQSISLGNLVSDSVDKIDAIRSRFVVKPLEEAKPVEEDDNEEFDNCRKNIERDIQDNLKELDELKNDMLELQRQAREDSELKDIQAEINSVEVKLVGLRNSKSMKEGSRMQMARELSRYKSELSGLNNVNTEYAVTLGKMVVNRTAVGDLEKLKQCFQDSITTFHDQMILKINEVLKARWRQVYRGGDIDLIELVDEEITRGKEKKSYNYYMAMHKGGLRMKMREKSSAGQRALASIILRITLAELFVKDFAFIALDEPTSNLDVSNVQALAKSIGRYVRRRAKKGANIQWIIITHDEIFLRSLDEECSPYFYRTQMDKDGHSEIFKIAYESPETEVHECD